MTVDATDYSMNITRSVPVMPVPVLGERYGIDLNMVWLTSKSMSYSLTTIARRVSLNQLPQRPVDFSVLANSDGRTRQSYLSGAVHRFIERPQRSVFFN